jgi:hypothetical protein
VLTYEFALLEHKGPTLPGNVKVATGKGLGGTASRMTRSTLSGIAAYLAFSNRASWQDSANLTLNSMFGGKRSSPSDGIRLV